MKINYPLAQQFIARLLLVSLCLQSCGGGFDNNPLIPTREEQIASTQTNTQAILPRADIQPLVDQVLTAQEGHAVTFYEYKGELQASVQLLDDDHKVYNGVHVVIEKGADLRSLPHLTKKIQGNRIHLQLAQGGNPARVLIYKDAGLMGGSNTGKDKGKEKVEEEEKGTKQKEVSSIDLEEAKLEEDGQETIISEMSMMSLSTEQEPMVYIPKNISSNEIQNIRIQANKGDADAQYKLGQIYENGWGVSPDSQEASRWYIEAGDQDYDEAKKAVISMCISRDNFLLSKNPEDWEKIIQWCKDQHKDVEDGRLEYAVACIYRRAGQHKQAVTWYHKAVQEGDLKAKVELDKIYEQGAAEEQYQIGKIYEYGHGVEQAAIWYQKAAQEGNEKAEYRLGFLYENGQGVDQDYEKAVEWYQEAAEQGSQIAKARLARMIYYGWGIEMNLLEAQNICKQVKDSIRSAAEKGDVDYQFMLGWMYHAGCGLEEDKQEALKWFMKAAMQGNVRAHYLVGLCYVGKDQKKAIEWFGKAAERGQKEAQYKLGLMYQSGDGVEQSDDKALQWLKASADQGYIEAQCALGEMYYYACSVEEDFTLAKYWFKKAAERGQKEAQYKLGLMYQSGDGVEQNDDKALQWLKASADQGYIEAQYALGKMYYYACSVEEDFTLAKYWFKKAAEQGDAEAQFKLGVMYYYGEGATKDTVKAFEWFQKAAEQGHAGAQFNLGVMYENGNGIGQDYEKAVICYKKAASQGSVEAQHNLGLMYVKGNGVAQDCEKAIVFFQKAAGQGCADAIEMLKRIPVHKPNYLINTIAYVPDDAEILAGEDSSDEDISGDFAEEMFNFDLNDLTKLPFRTFKEVDEKKKFQEGIEAGKPLPAPIQLRVSDKAMDSSVVQPFLSKLTAHAFELSEPTDLKRMSVSFALNRPRSLSTRRNRCLYKELGSFVNTNITYERFAFFWDYPWYEPARYCSPSYSKVRSFYKQLKRYDKEHATDKARVFREINEERVKHKVPYQALREKLKNHLNTKSLVSKFREHAPDSPIYFSLIDSDVINFNGIYTVYDQLFIRSKLFLAPIPIVMSTGYEFPSMAENLPINFNKRIKVMLPALKFASQLDRITRAATASSIPLGVYYPEPNLCVLLPEGALTLPETFIGQSRGEASNGNLESSALLKQFTEEGNTKRVGIVISNQTFIFSNRSPLITAIPDRATKYKQQKGDGTSNHIYFSGPFQAGRYKEITIQDINNCMLIAQSHANKRNWAENLYRHRAISLNNMGFGRFLSEVGEVYGYEHPLYSPSLEIMEERVNHILAGKELEYISHIEDLLTDQDIPLVQAAIRKTYIEIAKFLRETVFSKNLEKEQKLQESEMDIEKLDDQGKELYSDHIAQDIDSKDNKFISEKKDFLEGHNYEGLEIPVRQGIEINLPITANPINKVERVFYYDYKIDGKTFKRQNVSGNGMRCFFNASGLDVGKQISKLIQHQNDPIVRYMIANEIVSATENPDELPVEIKIAIDYKLYQAQQQEINNLRKKRNEALQEQSSDEAKQNIHTLPKELKDIDQKEAEILADLRQKACSLEAFKSFINYHIRNGEMMVMLADVQGDNPENHKANYTSIDAIAYINDLGIKIYNPVKDKQGKIVSGKLTLTHQFIPCNATKIIYLYYDNNHFQAFIPQQT